MENQKYMQEGLDVKRILLLFRKKLWVAAAAAAAGALLFAGGYLLIHLAAASEREFESVSKLYLYFNCDPQDFNELTYNGYTWNDLMATDPILNYTMEALPAGTDRDMVIGATKAEILSDIRLLTITITTNEAEQTAQIMEATQKALVHLGETDDLFDSIEVYSTEGPRQIVWDNRTVNAAVTGAVIGLLAALLALAFYYVLDDSVYVAQDAEQRYGVPVFGLFVKSKGEEQPYGEEFAANYSYLCRNMKTAALVSIDTEADAEEAGRMIGLVTADREVVKPAEKNRGTGSGREAVKPAEKNRGTGSGRGAVVKPVEKKRGMGSGREVVKPAEGNRETGEEARGDRLPRLSILGSVNDGAEVYRKIRETDGVILSVRFGGGNGKLLERTLGNLKKQDCRVSGIVIIKADETFLKWYYMGSRKKRNGSDT